MKILVGCEFSGRVRSAFRRLGHDAWSCDLLESEDGSPFHIQGDVIPLLADGWDLAIFNPPCTYLCASGMHWTKRGKRDPQQTEDALAFVRILMDAPIPRIAIENPISIISSRIRPPDQIVNPYQFGEDASKKTCFWLKALPPLKPTKMVAPRMVCCRMVIENGDKSACPNCNGEKAALPRWGNQCDSGQNKLGPSAIRAKERSRTYWGIANAMADQWGLTCWNPRLSLMPPYPGGRHE